MTMGDSTVVSIDDIKLWTVPALKDYLRKRNLKVSGRKMMPELAAPATSAGVAEQQQKKYGDLSKTPTGSLPDPHGLVQGWDLSNQSSQMKHLIT